MESRIYFQREMTELTDGLAKSKDREQPLEIFSGFERSKSKHFSSWKVVQLWHQAMITWYVYLVYGVNCFENLISSLLGRVLLFL